MLYNVVVKILARIPIIGAPMRALDLYRKTVVLEKAERFEEAQNLRDRAILSLNPKYHGPLLRSKGQDYLYRLKDYKSALEAFEKAEIALEKSPALYGVAQPDAILAGIATSAVHMGDIDKAMIYRDKFIKLYQDLKRHSKENDALKWHEEIIEWLNNAIESST